MELDWQPRPHDLGPVPLDRLEEATELVLRVGRHLGHALHLPEGDVPALRLLEQLAGIFGGRELGDHAHRVGDVRQRLRGVQCGQLGGALDAFRRHPLEQRRMGRRRSDHAPPGLALADDVDAQPVERSLPRGDLGQRQHVVEPVLEPQLLDAGHQGVVERQVDVLAHARLPGRPHAGQPADGGHERAEVEVLAAERVGCDVRRTRHGEHAAQGARDEIAGLPVGPRSVLTERGERDLHQQWILSGQCAVVDAALGELARPLGIDDEIGLRRHPTVPLAVAVLVQPQRDTGLAALVPPVEQPAPLVGSGVGHRRPMVGRAVRDPDHRRPCLGEQLRRQPPRLAAHIEHPQSGQRARSSRDHHILLATAQVSWHVSGCCTTTAVPKS